MPVDFENRIMQAVPRQSNDADCKKLNGAVDCAVFRQSDHFAEGCAQGPKQDSANDQTRVYGNRRQYHAILDKQQGDATEGHGHADPSGDRGMFVEQKPVIEKHTNGGGGKDQGSEITVHILFGHSDQTIAADQQQDADSDGIGHLPARGQRIEMAFDQ